MPAENSETADFDPAHFVLDCRGRTLDCRPGLEVGAQVMGILNVTPDSFSDGGHFIEADAALRRVAEMLEEKATVIDVGGESSRPRGSAYGAGAEAVSVGEEIRRVVPVVEAIAERFPMAIVSVDTYKPEVARAVLEAGAHIINDVTGLRFTTETASAAAEFGAPLIVMHSLGKPGDMPAVHRYEDVVAEVRSSLAESVSRAVAAGAKQVIVDPGFGFGKTPRENLRLVREVQTLLSLGRPVLLGVSRKSTIGSYLGRPGEPAPVERRLYGSLGVTAAGVLRGASIVRTHDVAPTCEMLRLIGAVARS